MVTSQEKEKYSSQANQGLWEHPKMSARCVRLGRKAERGRALRPCWNCQINVTFFPCNLSITSLENVIGVTSNVASKNETEEHLNSKFGRSEFSLSSVFNKVSLIEIETIALHRRLIHAGYTIALSVSAVDLGWVTFTD